MLHSMKYINGTLVPILVNKVAKQYGLTYDQAYYAIVLNLMRHGYEDKPLAPVFVLMIARELLTRRLL